MPRCEDIRVRWRGGSQAQCRDAGFLHVVFGDADAVELGYPLPLIMYAVFPSAKH